MRYWIGTTLLAVVLAAAGCGGDTAASAIYDGAGCTYDGPTAVSVGDEVRFTFTNESETTDVVFNVARLPEGTTQDDIFETGLDEISEGETILDLYAPSPIGEERSDTATFASAGLFGAACTDFSGGENDGQGLSYVTLIEATE